MKTNFRKNEINSNKNPSDNIVKSNQTDLTKEQFEEYMIKCQIKGSFMIYRSSKKEEELGIDEL